MFQPSYAIYRSDQGHARMFIVFDPASLPPGAPVRAVVHEDVKRLMVKSGALFLPGFESYFAGIVWGADVPVSRPGVTNDPDLVSLARRFIADMDGGTYEDGAIIYPENSPSARNSSSSPEIPPSRGRGRRSPGRRR